MNTEASNKMEDIILDFNQLTYLKINFEFNRYDGCITQRFIPK